MIPYASQTSGPNRRAIEAAGWRQFVSPDTRAKNGTPTTAYAIDNGAWGAHLRGQPWPEEPFLRVVDELGAQADFVVVPDVVGDRVLLCGKYTDQCLHDAAEVRAAFKLALRLGKHTRGE